jgi:hypothetical protein
VESLASEKMRQIHRLEHRIIPKVVSTLESDASEHGGVRWNRLAPKTMRQVKELVHDLIGKVRSLFRIMH